MIETEDRTKLISDAELMLSKQYAVLKKERDKLIEQAHKLEERMWGYQREITRLQRVRFELKALEAKPQPTEIVELQNRTGLSLTEIQRGLDLLNKEKTAE